MGHLLGSLNLVNNGGDRPRTKTPANLLSLPAGQQVEDDTFLLLVSS